METQRFLRLLAVLSVAAVSLLAGCKISSEDVEMWKGTVKGPHKLVAVMLSEKYPLELRTQAAVALVEMEREDVDGVAELQRALQRLDEATRGQVITGMAPGLEALMQRAGDEKLTQRAQIRAKDAAYLLITHAPAGVREKLMAAVVGWYVVDFNGRSLAGNYSAEQVVRSLGSPAATMLVDAMGAQMPQAALVKLAELVGQLADAEGKERAAARVLAIQEEMMSDAFVAWLKSKIVEQIEAARPGSPIDQAYVNATAAINRDNFVNDGALPAMKQLASVGPVANRLLELAEASGTDDATVERRKRALQALEGNATKEHLQRLLALATGNHPIAVRDYAFDRIGDIRSTDAIAPMWPLVQGTEDGRLRWRAAELVLHLGGPNIVPEFFNRLPAGDVSYEPEELVGYATRLSQMTPPPTQLVKAQLTSPDWWDRVIALRYLERRGVEADVAAMQRLVSDSAATKGTHWAPAESTVGKLADDAIKGLRERLAAPSDLEQGS